MELEPKVAPNLDIAHGVNETKPTDKTNKVNTADETNKINPAEQMDKIPELPTFNFKLLCSLAVSSIALLTGSFAILCTNLVGFGIALTGMGISGMIAATGFFSRSRGDDNLLTNQSARSVLV